MFRWLAGQGQKFASAHVDARVAHEGIRITAAPFFKGIPRIYDANDNVTKYDH